MNEANYYCIQERVPICSIECKYYLQSLKNSIDYPFRKEKSLEKGFMIFRYLLKLVMARNEKTDHSFRLYVMKILRESIRSAGSKFLNL